MPTLNRSDAAALDALAKGCLTPGSYFNIPKYLRCKPLTPKPLASLVAKGFAEKAQGDDWTYTVTLKGVEALEAYQRDAFPNAVLAYIEKDHGVEKEAVYREVVRQLCRILAEDPRARAAFWASPRR